MTTQDCELDDIRFDAVLYASSSVDSKGEPYQEELIEDFRTSAFEWHPANEPYYCAGCDQYFKNWEAVREHLGRYGHSNAVCSKYNETALPDEHGNCSLCGRTLEKVAI